MKIKISFFLMKFSLFFNQKLRINIKTDFILKLRTERLLTQYKIVNQTLHSIYLLKSSNCLPKNRNNTKLLNENEILTLFNDSIQILSLTELQLDKDRNLFFNFNFEKLNKEFKLLIENLLESVLNKRNLLYNLNLNSLILQQEIHPLVEQYFESTQYLLKISKKLILTYQQFKLQFINFQFNYFQKFYFQVFHFSSKFKFKNQLNLTNSLIECIGREKVLKSCQNSISNINLFIKQTIIIGRELELMK